MASGGDPEPILTQPVVSRVSVRAFESQPPSIVDFGDLDGTDVSDLDGGSPSAGARLASAVPWLDGLPSTAELLRRLPMAAFEGALGAVAIMLISHDERLSVAGGILVGVAAILRTIDRRITFSFGAGFLGYRSDMGWPQGVQEDDDVHWRWRPADSGQVNQPS